jgi:hypothetical protein
MERGRDHRYAGKRSFSEISESDQEYELSMRHKALEYNNDHHRRERERPRSPAWCRDEPQYRDDHRWFEAGSSAPRAPPMEDSSRRFRNFKTTVSKRRKAAVSDQVHSAPAPIPSVALFSNPE